MLFRLFLCFTLIPMIELYLLIQVGSVIGGFNTIILVVISGFLGAWLARMEGMNTLMRVRTNMQQGIMPTEDLLDGLIILIAGIVLITPGLLTDAMGITLLWPVSRNAVKQFLRKKFDEWTSNNTIDITRL
ncbi:MAG: FxsA family protein [Desulfobacterium sp.]